MPYLDGAGPGVGDGKLSEPRSGCVRDSQEGHGAIWSITFI